MIIKCSNTAKMLELGKQLAYKIQLPLVIFLHGGLGVGKTTFTRGILQGLGYNDVVNSPSYSIMESYHLPTSIVQHCDFYRIANPGTIAHLGLDEYWQENSLFCIEWPEHAIAMLPAPDLQIYFRISAAELRIVDLQSNSALGNCILNNLATVL